MQEGGRADAGEGGEHLRSSLDSLVAAAPYSKLYINHRRRRHLRFIGTVEGGEEGGGGQTVDSRQVL